MLLCDTAQAKEKVNITKVTINGTTLKSDGNGEYSGVIPSGNNTLQLSIYSDDYKKLTEYNLNASITFTYPQTVGGYLNITPIYADGEKHFLAQIGTIVSNNHNLTYHPKDYYTQGGMNFSHGGYFTAFGGSDTKQTLNTDLTYQFNNTASYLGLYFESNSAFPTAQRTVTITINYLDAAEKAIIENAETTKNIFEWLQDGFVKLIVPTSDGIEEMLDSTSSTLETRLGILYLPIRFAGSLLGMLTATLEGAVSGQAITVPQWNITLFGHDYILWHKTTFSMSDNAIFHYIVFDLGLILLIRIGYLVAMFTSIILTINTCTDNMFDEEFAYFTTDLEPLDYYEDWATKRTADRFDDL